MKLPSYQFLQISDPISNDILSPELQSMIRAWDHIADRYIKRIEPNRILAGRIRSIRLLAVHDAVRSVIDPGYGYIFNGLSLSASNDAAIAAVAQAAHDILATVFHSPGDQADLAELLDESLAFIPDSDDRAEGALTGSASAATYTSTFAAFLEDKAPAGNRTRFQKAGDSSWQGGWRKSA